MAKTLVLRTPKPRNPVLHALLSRALSVGVGRHKRTRNLSRQAEQRDLAQRVRESGEW